MIEQAGNKYRKLSEEEKEIKKDMEKIDIKICQKKVWMSTKKVIVINKNQRASLNLVINILIK